MRTESAGSIRGSERIKKVLKIVNYFKSIPNILNALKNKKGRFVFDFRKLISVGILKTSFT